MNITKRLGKHIKMEQKETKQKKLTDIEKQHFTYWLGLGQYIHSICASNLAKYSEVSFYFLEGRLYFKDSKRISKEQIPKNLIKETITPEGEVEDYGEFIGLADDLVTSWKTYAKKRFVKDKPLGYFG